VTEKRTSSLLAVAAGVVERTLSWITRYRRTDRGYERLPQHHETMVYLVMITIMGRRLASRQGMLLQMSSSGFDAIGASDFVVDLAGDCSLEAAHYVLFG